MIVKAFVMRVLPLWWPRIRFYLSTGYWPSDKQPQTINERLFQLIERSSEEYATYVDKLQVRVFVSELQALGKLDKLKVPDIIAEGRSVEEFVTRFDGREAFVKANHGSGMCFYHDGSGSELSRERYKEMRWWLKLDFALVSGERCYKNVPRAIFAEAPLRCSDGSFPDDVKVHCCCGEPIMTQVLRRTSGELERQTYDTEWRHQGWFKNQVLEVDLDSVPTERVLQYARILSEGFPYVRVDFYLVDGDLYFSELTFYPASAKLPLVSREVDLMLGQRCAARCAGKRLERE